MLTIVTPSAEHLDLEAETLVRHPDNDVRAFPDGEVYIQLDDVEELDEALVVHAGMPEPNRGLSYLTGLLDLLAGHDVRTEVFFSYMPYGMQDEVFFDGSLNYARALLRRLTGYYGVQQVHVVDAHFCHRPWTEEFPFQCVHAFPLLAEDIDMEPCTVLGPDRGAEKRFGIESFSKQRENSYTVSIEGDGDVEGKNVLVFDDIIETGG
ncbi:MAG: hypothetical protein SVU32_05220, partial [Candidatus Nanohaloarchaea archaeon]|nr:hypothetical protein [Candidatus Nanohaloarchaea archaeon]